MPVFPRLREAINNMTQNHCHRQDSALNGCHGGHRNVTPKCIASGAKVCEGGYTVTPSINSANAISNIIASTSTNQAANNITVTPSATQAQISAFNNALKTGDNAVTIQEGVKAKMVDGRIVAEISLSGELANATSVSYELKGDRVSGQPAPTDLKAHKKSHGAELQTEKSEGKFTVSPAGKYDSMTLTFTRSDGTTKKIQITRDQIEKLNQKSGEAAGASAPISSPPISSPSDVNPSNAIVDPAEVKAHRAAKSLVAELKNNGTPIEIKSGGPSETEAVKQLIQTKLETNINHKTKYESLNTTLTDYEYAVERGAVIAKAGPELVAAIKVHPKKTQKLMVDALIESKDVKVEEVRDLVDKFSKAQSSGIFKSNKTALGEIEFKLKNTPGLKELAGLVWDVEYRNPWWGFRKTADFLGQLKHELGRELQRIE